jgi:hypothetical protein
VDYDAVVLMTFASEEHLGAFQKKYAEPDVAKRIGESAEKFIVGSKLVVMGLEEPCVAFA